MTTTAIIVEILMIGFTALVWIFIILSLDSSLSIVSIFNKYKEWSTFITIMAIAFAYQIGWLISHLSFLLMKYVFFRKKMTIVYFESHNYEEARNIVYQKASDYLQKELAKDFSIIRLTRTGIINFLLIGVLLLIIEYWILGSFSILIFIGCIFMWRYRHREYFKKIAEAHKYFITNNSDNSKDNSE